MNRNNSEQRQSGEPSQDFSNTRKDPEQWTTGNEPMTGAQHSYLKTLSDEAGEPMDESLSKAEASKRIEELQHKTGRGLEQENDTNETDSQRREKDEDGGIRGGKSSL